eukprot:3552704-Pyramimonas_sp.AAC.1
MCIRDRFTPVTGWGGFAPVTGWGGFAPVTGWGGFAAVTGWIHTWTTWSGAKRMMAASTTVVMNIPAPPTALMARGTSWAFAREAARCNTEHRAERVSE